MHKETKRYLLNQNSIDLISDLGENARSHTIFFTKIKLCKEVRYEHTPGHYMKIIRSGAQYTQTVTYQHITKRAFQKAIRNQKGETIIKQRHPLQIEKCRLYVDVYRKQLDGLYILEIPFECQKRQPLLIQHKLLDPYILSEITEDPRYEEKYLARFGNPSRHPYNIYTIFKDIEHQRIQDPDSVIFKEMKNADAIRTILYHRFIMLQRYVTQIRLSKVTDAEAMIAFHSLVLESGNIIKSFEQVFDELPLQKLTNHLLKMERLTQTFRDLTLIQNRISNLSHADQNPYMQKLIVNLKERIDNEYHKIIRYFNSREYSIIKSQYELLLKETNRSYTTYEAQLPLGYSLKIKYQNLYTQFIRLIDFLDGCNDEKSYEKILSHLEEFMTFISTFQNQYPLKKRPKIFKLAQKVFKQFQKYEKRNKDLLILEMLMTHMEQTTQSDTMRKHLKKRRQKLLNKQKQFESKIFTLLQQFQTNRNS